MPPLAGIRGKRLKDKRGLADARIAAHQERRARHQPAARDAVEFGNAGGAARGFLVLGLQILQREGPPLAALRAVAPAGGAARFLNDAVPAAAGIAAARPFGIGGPAGLANESDGEPRVPSAAHLHLDRSFCAAVDELIDIGIAAAVDLGRRAVPDDLALVEHGDAVGDFACADHVMGDRQCGRAQIAHGVDNQID